MPGDDEHPEHIADQATTDNAATEAMQANVAETANLMHEATEAAATQTEQWNSRATEAAAAGARGAAEAFHEARERLTTMQPFAIPAFDTMRQSGEGFAQGMQSSYASTLENMAEFNSKAVAAWRANAESTIQHWQSLAGVKTMSEAIALSAEHTRKQMEAMSSQAKELSDLASRMVRDAADPLKMMGR
jgi:phasin family protein